MAAGTKDKATQRATPYLVFCSIAFLQGAILFGIDTGSFGSIQALPSFLTRFGVKDATGNFILPPARKSMMNSLPWIGKIVGCFGSEPVIERMGYKKTMYILSIIQIVAVIIELTASQWAQFTVGRIIAYFAVGLVENAVPSYNAEVSPAAIRGLLSGSLMVFTGLGNLWGSGMSRAYASETASKGWIIPTSMQLIPAVGLLVLVPFTQESPRWLIRKGRKKDAYQALSKLRTKEEVENGTVKADIETLGVLAEAAECAEEGTWLDLFRGTNLRRTWISATLFVLEQTNGNQFVQSYGATFYVQQGLGSNSFTYTTVGQVVGIVGCAIGVYLLDITGRRPLMIGGSIVCTVLLYLAAGLGLNKRPNENEENTIIACFMLLPAFTRISASNICFLTGAEIGSKALRKKTMAFGTACDVAAAFLVTFVTPYLLPHMGVNIGWIFGSVAAFSIIWSILFFPELKGRSLEEVDVLFEAKLYSWQFANFETQTALHLSPPIKDTNTITSPSKDCELAHAV